MIIKYIKIVAFSAVMVFLMSFTACAAEGEEYDRIHGFETGVDDYVVKPFLQKSL